jgi:hypothetical protein
MRTTCESLAVNSAPGDASNPKDGQAGSRLASRYTCGRRRDAAGGGRFERSREPGLAGTETSLDCRGEVNPVRSRRPDPNHHRTLAIAHRNDPIPADQRRCQGHPLRSPQLPAAANRLALGGRLAAAVHRCNRPTGHCLSAQANTAPTADRSVETPSRPADQQRLQPPPPQERSTTQTRALPRCVRAWPLPGPPRRACRGRVRGRPW